MSAKLSFRFRTTRGQPHVSWKLSGYQWSLRSAIRDGPSVGHQSWSLREEI